jgi:hypothetical protein
MMERGASPTRNGGALAQNPRGFHAPGLGAVQRNQEIGLRPEVERVADATQQTIHFPKRSEPVEIQDRQQWRMGHKFFVRHVFLAPPPFLASSDKNTTGLFRKLRVREAKTFSEGGTITDLQ